MIAMEKGLFDLQDEVYKYIPVFKDIKVAVLKGTNVSPNYVWATQKNQPNYFWRVYGRVMRWFSEETPYMYVPENSARPRARAHLVMFPWVFAQIPSEHTCANTSTHKMRLRENTGATLSPQ